MWSSLERLLGRLESLPHAPGVTFAVVPFEDYFSGMGYLGAMRLIFLAVRLVLP